MKRLMFTPLCLLAVSCTQTEVGEAPPAPTAIAGVVYDASDGAPLTGAEVFTVPATARATTDENGGFLLADVTPGAYEVHATLQGYAPNQVNVTAAEGDVTGADITLGAAQPELTLDNRTLDLGSDSSVAMLMVSNAGPSGTSLVWSAEAPEPWLSVGTGGTLAASESSMLQVMVDRTALGQTYGAREALVTVVSNGGEARVVVRLVHVDPNAPRLAYDYEVLDFGESQDMRTLEVRNEGTGMLDWQAQFDLPWLTVSPDMGQVGAGDAQTLTLTVDRSSVPHGSSVDGPLTFTSNSVIDDAVPLRVRVARPDLVAWMVDSNPLDFGETRIDGAVRIENRGTDILRWSSSVSQPFLRVVPDSGEIAEAANVDAYVVVDRSMLSPGPFSANVTLTSAAGSETIAVSGTFVARPLASFTRALDLDNRGEAIATGTLAITNAGTGTLRWSVTTTTTWLRVNPAMGTSQNVNCLIFGDPLLPRCGELVTVEAVRAQMTTAGNYAGSVWVEDLDSGERERVPVRIGIHELHWRSFALPAGLGPRALPGMAYDVLRDRMVLVGGRPQGLMVTPYADQWELDGDTWSIAANAPPGAIDPLLVYDRRRGRMVFIDDDVSYELVGGTWVGPTPAPGIVNAAFNDNTGRIVGASFAGTTSMVLYDLTDDGWVASALADAPTMCGDRMFFWQSQLHCDSNTTSARLDAGQWSTIAPIGLTKRATPVLVDPQDQRIYEFGGLWIGSLFSNSMSVAFAPADPHPNIAPQPSVRRSNAFGRFEDNTLLMPQNQTFGRRGHSGVAWDTRRQRAVLAAGVCSGGIRYGIDPMFEACDDTLVMYPTVQTLPPVENPQLALSSMTLDFGAAQTSLVVTLTNSGTGQLDYSAVGPDGLDGFTMTPDWGRISAGQTAQVMVSVDRSQLPAGPSTTAWQIRSDGGDLQVDLRVTR